MYVVPVRGASNVMPLGWGKKERTMPKIRIRCLLTVAACQLLLGPSASPAQDWDPIAYGIAHGSLVGSIAYQPPSGKGSGINSGSCDPDEVEVQAFRSELLSACSRTLYFPRGRRCGVCIPKADLDGENQGTSNEEEPPGRWVIKDSKNPNAFELELGRLEFEDAADVGFEEDVFFIGAGYRRFLLHGGKRDSFRLLAGVGLGAYYLSSDDAERQSGTEFGFNAKIGAEIGINPRAKDVPKAYYTLELAVVHHRVDSDIESTGGMIGFRVHLPGDNCCPAAGGGGRP